jgi:MFS family permease
MYPGILILAAGLAVSLAAVLLASEAHSVCLPVGLGIAGLGGGLVTVPFFSAALARVQPSETGSAVSLLNSVQQLGGTLGIAALGTIAATLTPAVAGTAVALAGTVVLALVLFLSARSMLTVDSRRVGEKDVR